MKTSLFSALLCLGITLAAAPSPEKVAEVKAGKITEACASWWGFNEEDSAEFLQAALNSGVRKLTVDYTGKDWVAGKTLTLPSNLELVIADKVVVKAKRGAFKGLGDALFRAPGSRNLTIRGEGSATLMMHRRDYADSTKYRVGEWRHIIYLFGVTDVVIRDIRLTGSGGDGIYVGAGVQPYCKNVRIENVTADDSNRLGIAVISAEDLLIRNCRFVRTAGLSPAGGLDFEPNRPAERLVNCVVENCLFENNRGAGISVSPNHLNKDSLPVSITFRNCRSAGNAHGMFLYPTRDSKAAPVKGKVEFINCEFLNNCNLFQDPVADSIQFLFRNCRFTPSEKKGAVMEMICKHASGRRIGGLFFENCTMECDPAKNPPLALLYQGNGAVSNEISGSLKVVNDGKTEMFDFPAFIRERQAYFDKINSLKNAVKLDLPSMKRLKTARPRFRNEACLRGKFTYLQYAEKGETVTVNVRIISGGYPQNVDMELQAPDGRRLRHLSFPPDKKDNAVTFTAAETGYHILTGVTVQRVDISSSRPGGAYLVKDGFQILLPISGKLYFEVPEGVAEFQLGISADDRASVALLNPEGKTVMARDDINSMTLFTGKRADASRSEIWAVEIRNAVWQVNVKMYEPLIPLLSSNPDTLPLKGDPDKTVRGFIPAENTALAESFANSGFEKIRDGFPLYWQKPSEAGAKVSVVTEKPFEGGNALRLESPAGLTLMSYSFLKAEPGAKIRVSAQVRGKGKFRFELSNYSAANRRWIRPNTTSPLYAADSADWQEISCELPVSAAVSADGPVGWLRYVLVLQKDSVLDIDNCRAETVK